MTLRKILDTKLLEYTGKRLRPSQISRIAEEIVNIFYQQDPYVGKDVDFIRGWNACLKQIKEKMGL